MNVLTIYVYIYIMCRDNGIYNILYMIYIIYDYLF